MPAPNVVQFSLNESQRNKLSDLALEGESIGLTAKRLLLTLIEGQAQETQSQDFSDRLSQLEEDFKALKDDRDQLLIRIATLQEEKLKLIEQPIEFTLSDLTHEFNKRIDSMDRITTKFDFVKEELESLNKRLQTLENTVKPSEQSLETKGLTNTQLANKLGVNRSTVNRWRKSEAGCSPTGDWQFSVNEQKWFPLV